MDLERLVSQINLEIDSGDVYLRLLESCDLCDLDGETKKWVLSDGGRENYYKALTIFSDKFLKNAYRVLDVGTYRGGSVAAFKASNNKLDIESIDVDLSNINNIDALSKDCNIHTVDDMYVYNIDYSKYDFIFVDVNHDGIQEELIHERIFNSGYKGLVFYDDIKLNPPMVEFWNSIGNNKIETNWHHSGYGVVEYV